MSNGIGRRDTLKLASTAAALGAGLGVVLKARDALAGDGSVKTAPLPGGIGPDKPLQLSGLQQVKIESYRKLRAEKGQLQIKLSQGGQLLYATTVPEEIAQLLLNAPGGQLQFKFYRAAAQGAALVPEPFREGLMQFSPSTPAPSVEAPKPALKGSVPTK